MFGFRSDGKKVKGMGIIDKAEPFFMPQRIDAVNYTTVKLKCDSIDEFIARERKNGISYNYMHIVIAAIVRILYVRKKLNRFIMRGSIYQRNYISVSMDIKKKLEDDGESVTLKFYFNVFFEISFNSLRDISIFFAASIKSSYSKFMSGCL